MTKLILQKIFTHTTILLVEDEALVSTMYARYLTAAGVKVVIASNGIEGLLALKKEKVHCIVCDIQLPKMNGYEMLKRVKQDALTRHIPVIILTNLKHRPQDIKKIKALGIKEYIIKSDIPLSALLKKITKHTTHTTKPEA